MAAPIPAYCRHCNTGFVIPNFVAGSGQFRMIGNKATCPSCGRDADIVDGEFRVAGDELIVINGPPITHAMVARLKEVVEKAREETLNAEEILAEVAGVSPELAEKLRKTGLLPYLLILLLLWLVNACEMNLKLDLNRLIEQVQGMEQSADRANNPAAPFPDHPAAPSVFSQSTLAARPEAPVSRQVRRQLERQARKRGRRNYV